MPRILICFLENNDGKITRTQPKKTKSFFVRALASGWHKTAEEKQLAEETKKGGGGVCGGARRKPPSHSSISLPPPRARINVKSSMVPAARTDQLNLNWLQKFCEAADAFRRNRKTRVTGGLHL